MTKIRQTLTVQSQEWLRIQLKSRIGNAPPQRKCTEKIVCFCSGSVKLHMSKNGTFFTPDFACHSPQVPWAARNATMYLDSLIKFQPYLISGHEIINRQQEEQNNHFVQCLYGKKIKALVLNMTHEGKQLWRWNQAHHFLYYEMGHLVRQSVKPKKPTRFK